MRTSHLTLDAWGRVPVHTCHTLVLGSGAAGLNAAVQLHRHGLTDVLIVTEGLACGTSINTGSDKQTYYKLGLCGATSDSPRELAETYFAGGAMHGDLALVEAACSARAFLNLVNLGVPFPRDRFGQFVGYKTDHDPRQRATSTGPYTSRDMCRALIAELRRLRLPVHEHRTAVSLLTVAGHAVDAPLRCAGIVTLDHAGLASVYLAENTIFAVGGPGGLYQHSVYPAGHTGAIGLALEAGAHAQNLPESQHGLASLRHRWNVSGTYMQVIPRVTSTTRDGGTPEEFLLGWFGTRAEVWNHVFLKGYQWPFDARKVAGGSSLIDLLVFYETIVRGRRVFLDYRANPSGWSSTDLGAEARDYLERCGATSGTPYDRLVAMNPGAVQLYRDHGIDLAIEPLEVAVCSQHNNGGLAANLWWESPSLPHLFPVGEVNGSHGLYRPGGAALNSGQVGSLRAVEFIAARPATRTLNRRAARHAAAERLTDLAGWLLRSNKAATGWRAERDEIQARMSRAGALLRSADGLHQAVAEAREQATRLEQQGCRWGAGGERSEALRTRTLCLAQRAYLEAVAFAVAQGVGSRGSALVLAPTGVPIHAQLPADWRLLPENPAFREQVQETWLTAAGNVTNRWTPRRPIPESDTWFETAWAAFRDGRIYN